MKRFLYSSIFVVSIFLFSFVSLGQVHADFPGSDKPELQPVTVAGERTFTIDIRDTIPMGAQMNFMFRVDSGAWEPATMTGFFAYGDPIVNYATPPSGEVNELRISASAYTMPYFIDEGPSDVTVVWDAGTDLGVVEESDVQFAVSYTDGADWFAMSDSFTIDLIPIPALGLADTFAATHTVDPEFGGYMSVVMWKNAAESVWYKLERESVETGERVVVRGYSTGTTVADSGVEKGEKYVYYATLRDSSYNESTEVSIIETIPLEITDNRPPAPTGVTATGVPISSGSAHQTGVHLEWNDVAEADNGYYIFDGERSELGSSLTSEAYFYGLTPGETYSYTVYALNALALGSAPSETVSITLPIISAPAIPTGVSASADSDTEITVTWTTLPDTTYEVSDASGSQLRSFMSSGSFTHTGLTPETTYKYTIKAKKDGLESDFSSTATATTLATEAVEDDVEEEDAPEEEAGSGGGSSSGGSSSGSGSGSDTDDDEDDALADGVFTRTKLVLPAGCPDIYTGDRVSLVGGAAVYFITADGKYKYFPSSHEYDTWYDSFDGIVSDVPRSCFSTLQKASKNGMTFRSGSRLIKNRLDREVYAVTPGGVLRAIPDEATAKRLFGDRWDDERIVIGDIFWGNYTIGDPINTVRTTPLTGQVFRANGQVYQMISNDTAQRVNGTPRATRTFVRTYPAAILESLTVVTELLDRSRITDIHRYRSGL